MKISEVVVGVVLFFALILGIDWLATGNNFFLYKYFGPKYEQARRQTYEQTKSYRQGSIQRLGELCRQVDSADSDHKGMLNDVVVHEFAEWDEASVPAYLRPCLAGARAAK
jgi:hypothetical protein